MPSLTRRPVHILALALLVGAAFAGSVVAQESGPVGDWDGMISGGGQEIAMTFHVVAGEDGTLSATLDVPSQGGMGVPLENVSFEDGVFSFGLSGVPGGASYEGTLNEDGSMMAGTWTQGPNAIELNMTRSDD